ncbi:MAG: tail fiber protein [Myxococcota bacterium]
MSEPFIAEVRIFAGNFAPRGWAFCNGQLLPISQNTALFSLVGTTYGGDGRSDFALPDLRGRAPMHAGQGSGLTSRRLGAQGGVTDVTLTEAQLPNHSHTVSASSTSSTSRDPSRRVLGQAPVYKASDTVAPMANGSLASTGDSQAHTNMQPYLGLNFIIALVGLYPSRS